MANLKKLAELRKEKGYTQTQFAEKLGMNRSLLAKIEVGIKKVPEIYFDKIFYLLGTTDIEEIPQDNDIDDELLEISIDIIDSILDPSDISKEERLDLLYRVYDLVEEVSIKNISTEELEAEVREIKARIESESEAKKAKKNLLKSIFSKKKI